jgi:tetratricopeptide (TPR) repeat protein
MAKQRRAAPRPAPKSGKTSPASSTKRSISTRQPQPRIPARVESPKIVPRASYTEAVAHYERGILAIQSHEYGQATEIFRSIIATYPDEKELHERIRLYLNVCERQQLVRTPAPQTVDELVFAATVALNAGRLQDAATHLERAREQHPDHEQVLYLLAVVQAQQGSLGYAADLLQRAIELNPDNRSIARNDPDLEPLRSNGIVRSLLEPPARPDRRRAGKLRGAR